MTVMTVTQVFNGRFDYSRCAAPGAWRAKRMICARRPVRVRPLIHATRRHLRNGRVSPGLIERYRRLLPWKWRLDLLLDLRQLTDAVALGRALAVEVLWRRIF